MGGHTLASLTIMLHLNQRFAFMYSCTAGSQEMTSTMMVSRLIFSLPVIKCLTIAFVPLNPAADFAHALLPRFANAHLTCVNCG